MTHTEQATDFTVALDAALHAADTATRWQDLPGVRKISHPAGEQLLFAPLHGGDDLDSIPYPLRIGCWIYWHQNERQTLDAVVAALKERQDSAALVEEALDEAAVPEMDGWGYRVGSPEDEMV